MDPYQALPSPQMTLLPAQGQYRSAPAPLPNQAPGQPLPMAQSYPGVPGNAVPAEAPSRWKGTQMLAGHRVTSAEQAATQPDTVIDVKPGGGGLLSKYDTFTMCRTIALLFTIAGFCGFAAPTILTAMLLAMDPDAAFWIGRYGLLAFLVPVFFLAQHFYHVRAINKHSQDGNPLSRKFLLAVVLIPGAFFCVVGGCYMSQAFYWDQVINTQDCVNPAKQRLQQSYLQAKELYEKCTSRLVAENNNVPLARKITLPMCEEYFRQWNEEEIAQSLATRTLGMTPWKGYPLRDETSLLPKSASLKFFEDHRREWNYLAAAEANHVCGGFCEPGPMLWQTQRPGFISNCAPYIALKFKVVAYEGELLLIVNLLICTSVLLLFHFARTPLEKLGYD